MAYGSDAAFEAFIMELGLSLPASPPTSAMMRQLGSLYVDGTYGKDFTGTVVSPTQENEWPRIGAFRGSTPLSSSDIPTPVEQAAYFAGWYAGTNPDAFFTAGTMTEVVKRETVGPLTTEYAVSNLSAEELASALVVKIPFVDGLLSAFLIDRSVSAIGIYSVGN